MIPSQLPPSTLRAGTWNPAHNPPADPKSLDRLSAHVEAGLKLRQGASGPAVLELQNRLRDLGYPLAADGKFGPETGLAVLQFQRDMRDQQTAKGGVPDFKIDGIVGDQTLLAIQRGRPEIREATPASQLGAGLTHAAPPPSAPHEPGTLRPADFAPILV